jgi:ABC-2 type transport system ATP-binding protein
MVSVSHERLKSLKNVTVEKQNCFSLSYPDSSFDAVVVVNLLHVISEPKKAIQESKRVLRVSGDIIVISFTIEGMSLLSKFGMIYRYLRTYGKPPKTGQTLTIDAAKAMIATCGFKIRQACLIGETSKALFVRATA